ncbi:MAG: acetyl-CoA carboxylase carboxyl transferase subunit alpha/beta, partial [Desulfobulbus sp.]|nr:acetyl-CoA carboxylase carboxyl transferase subunit alpha/beta [Desulfobulbus sp.]
MNEQLQQLQKIEERISYLLQIKDYSSWGNLDGFKATCERLKQTMYDHTVERMQSEIRKLNDSISFLEERAEEHLTPMERVRIVRSAQRFSLKDILENVYEDYTELGGEDDASVDPAMICAKATIIRRVNKKPRTASVMVIGQESGHGEEYRNGGSCRPEGNAKARRYMKVAADEGIPIHFYIFTPGSYPVEEYPGAAQQIARNIYTMTKLPVPMVSLISEGGSGGAEAIGLADYRLMCSHGYYSVISPEGAAAIEGRVEDGGKVAWELVEVCADRLRLTASDNLRHGTIDRIIQEPPLGARRDDFTFFTTLRAEMLRATDHVVISTKNFSSFRNWELHRRQRHGGDKELSVDISWDLNNGEVKKLLALRSKKYLNMGKNAYHGRPDSSRELLGQAKENTEKFYYKLRYDFLKKQKKQVDKALLDLGGESTLLVKRLTLPITSILAKWRKKPEENPTPVLPTVVPSSVEPARDPLELTDTYVSPQARVDRTVSCPNAARYGCKDIWVPDLYSEFAGVCESCGHHFPLEYQWYLRNVFDKRSVCFFNTQIAAGNPLDYTGFSDRLRAAREKTGYLAANLTFHAKINGIQMIVAMLFADFRGGTVGAAEGEKFV